MCCVQMEELAFVSDFDVDVDVDDDDGGGGFMICVACVARSASCAHLSSCKALFDATKEAKMQTSLKAEEEKVSLRQSTDWRGLPLIASQKNRGVDATLEFSPGA